ncbi:MAG: heme exporter protein A [Arenicella sp.]|jgi:heme exporter protein A
MVLLNSALCKTTLANISMSSSKVISINNLSCTRGDNQLFDAVSFTLNAGQCLHVTGPNGCGKTSLLRLIAGINLAEDGDISWNNSDTTNNPEFYTDCAYIAHKEGLKNELTAIENLRYYQHLDGGQDEIALDDILEQMSLLKCADLLAQQLSFGQRRRLSFARLLIADFALWILDEPFTGIDQSGRELIESLCVKHLQQGGLIIMTHHRSLIDSPLNQYRSELKLGRA